MSYLINMLPHQIEKAVHEQWPAIIVAGSVEFHGNHLPVGTDLILPEEIIKRVEPHVNIVVCPPIVYSPTGYAVSGPKEGTLDVRVNAFKEYLKDILLGLYRMGFKLIIVIQHHQGTEGPGAMAFKMAAAEIYNEEKEMYGEGWWTKNYREPQFPKLLNVKVLGLSIKGYPWPGSHGALGETEPMLVLRPDTVEMERLKRDDFPWNWDPENEADQASFNHGEGIVESIVQDWIQFFEGHYQEVCRNLY